MTGTIAFG